MKLRWQKGINVIEVIFNDGSKIECPASVWGRVASVLNDDLFITINQYWSMLTPEKIHKWEESYRAIFDLFSRRIDVKEFNVVAKPLVENLLNLFQWRDFRLWCILHGNLSMTNGIKETLDDKDRVGLTYYTDDYIDLLAFSVMLKTLMPIWGLYHEEYTNSVGKYFIHMAAVDLIRNPSLRTLPPVVKLESYISCFTDIKIKQAGFSLISGIGTEEIPTFLFALALVKKVIIFNIHDNDGNIVKNVYHLLAEKCTEISKAKPLEKKDRDVDGSELSISDRYKIIQRIPPSISVMMEHYVEDYTRLAKGIDITIPDGLLEKYGKIVKRDLDLSEFHIPILSIVCYGSIAGRSIKLIPYHSVNNIIISSAALLEHWGFTEIAELIITQPSEKDIYRLTTSMADNRSYMQLRPDMVEGLDHLYKYQSNGKNPGLLLIDNIMKEVLKYDWRYVRSENFSDLRNSLARLLLKQLGENKE